MISFSPQMLIIIIIIIFVACETPSKSSWALFPLLAFSCWATKAQTLPFESAGFWNWGTGRMHLKGAEKLNLQTQMRPKWDSIRDVYSRIHWYTWPNDDVQVLKMRKQGPKISKAQERGLESLKNFQQIFWIKKGSKPITLGLMFRLRTGRMIWAHQNSRIWARLAQVQYSFLHSLFVCYYVN